MNGNTSNFLAEDVVRVTLTPLAMSVQQVAAATSLSKRLVESLVADGLLPVIRVGSADSKSPRILIPTRELTEWLTQNIGRKVEVSKKTSE